MNLNDPRDLLWIAGICYGISFFVGMLKTFRFALLNQVPVLGIALGFLIQTWVLLPARPRSPWLSAWEYPRTDSGLSFGP